MAAAVGELRTIEAFAVVGADLNGGGRRGRTPLQAAADRERTDAVELLVKLGADLNVPDEDSRRVIHYAAYWGYADLVVRLVELGAMCDETDTDGVELVLSLKRANYVRKADSDTIAQILGCAADEQLDAAELKQRAEASFNKSRKALCTHLGTRLEGPVGRMTTHLSTVPPNVQLPEDALDSVPPSVEQSRRGSWAGEKPEDTLVEASKQTVARFEDNGQLKEAVQLNKLIAKIEKTRTKGLDPDGMLCDPKDPKIILWCERQKLLWVTYVCAHERLAKGTAGLHVSSAAYPAAGAQVTRGIAALARIRAILEYPNFQGSTQLQISRSFVGTTGCARTPAVLRAKEAQNLAMIEVSEIRGRLESANGLKASIFAEKLKVANAAADLALKAVEMAQSQAEATSDLLEMPETCPVSKDGTWGAALPEKLLKKRAANSKFYTFSTVPRAPSPRVPAEPTVEPTNHRDSTLSEWSLTSDEEPPKVEAEPLTAAAEQVFKEFDADASGRLERNEFEDLIRRHLNCDFISSADLDRYFESLDADGSGSIDPHEFGEFLKNFGGEPAPKPLTAEETVFNEFDADASGRLERDEFEDVIRRYLNCDFISSVQISSYFESLDADGSGSIDPHEFGEFLKNFGCEPAAEPITQPLTAEEKVFYEFDADLSGRIDKDEFEQIILKYMNCDSIAPDELDNYYLSLDRDADGSIDAYEFADFLKGLHRPERLLRGISDLSATTEEEEDEVYVPT